MKKNGLLLLFFFISGTTIFGQEEFLAGENGLSALFSHGFKTHEISSVNSVGLSLFFKNGLAFSAGIRPVQNNLYPLASVSLYTGKGKENSLNPAFGLSYSANEYYRIFGLNTALIQRIFPGKKFQSSFNISFSVFKGSTKEDEFYDEYGNNIYISDPGIIPVFGLGYTQALFSTGQIYPYIGFAYAYELSENQTMFSGFFGLNIRFVENRETVNN